MVSLSRVMALVVVAAWTAPAFAVAETRSDEAGVAQTSVAAGGQLASQSEVQQFQQREQQSQQLAQFEGGDDGVYIGGGVLLLALIVVLVVLLVR